MQFQEKLMIQTQENGREPHFGSDLGLLVPKSGREFFYSKIRHWQSLNIMVSYHHGQYQKKTNDQILRKLSDGRTDKRGYTDRQTRVIS